MEIRFLKKEDSNPVLICRRKDNSSTWIHLDGFFLRHDLMHYAVETTMQFKTAFYGMIANGISIADFELPKEQRNMELSDEAIYSEHIVNLMLIENREGRSNDFNGQLREGLQLNNPALNPVTVEKKQLEKIHSTYNDLMIKWNGLSKGESLTLQFEE